MPEGAGWYAEDSNFRWGGALPGRGGEIEEPCRAGPAAKLRAAAISHLKLSEEFDDSNTTRTRCHVARDRRPAL